MAAETKQARAILYLAAFVAAIALLAIYSLWDRAAELDVALREAQRREDKLEERIGATDREAAESGREAEAARARAEQARREAEAAGRARGQAEWERELAREAAERSKLEAQLSKAEAERSRREYERIRTARLRELERMREALSKIGDTERTPMGMVVTLAEDSFLFAFDKADLRPENREILSRVAGVLLASHGYRLYIDGHTDDQGDARYNQGLSERRARAVADYLVQAGVPDDIVEVRGFGKTNPRRQGTSSEARRKNRRVEIGIVDTVIEYEAREANP